MVTVHVGHYRLFFKMRLWCRSYVSGLYLVSVLVNTGPWLLQSY